MTGPQVRRNEAVRISDLVVQGDIIRNARFENCEIIGPAVTVLLGSTNINNCTWDAPDADALFWIIGDRRGSIVGAVGLEGCTFEGCHFRRIGIGVKEGDLDTMRASFGLT